MKVVIACGGTGGHLFPGLAVGEVLLAHGHEVLLLVSEKEIDRKALEGRTGFQVRQLPAVAWPGGISLHVFRFFRQLIHAKFFCRQLYREFAPDVVLAMGGFTSAAPLWEAARLNVPAVIHEANAIAGRANRLLARKATLVIVGFKEASSYFSSGKVVVEGTPVRRELKQKLDKSSVKAELGFDLDQPVILVMGGSQGARGINARVLEALPFLKDGAFQWAHLAGEGDEARLTAGYKQSGQLARVWPFYNQMHKLYSIADLIISRSGASSIAEINFFGLPAIYIPYPFAADGHQSANAQVEVKASAALCIEEKEAKGAALAGMIRELMGDSQRLRAMGLNSRRLAVDDAAEKVADLLCHLRES